MAPVDQALGQLFVVQILAAAVVALLGALIVQIVCKMVAKFMPPYGMAYKATFLGYVASVLVGFVVYFVIGALGQALTGTSTVLLMIIDLFVQAAIYSTMIKHPETGAIGFGKACQMILVELIFGALLMALLMALFAVLSVVIWYWHDISQWILSH